MKKGKLFVFSLLIFCIFSVKIYAANNIKDTYKIQYVNNYTNKFFNYVDGYSMDIPSNAVLSFDGDQNSSRLDFNGNTVKIFIQDFNKNFNYLDYEVYSMKGLLNNQNDHYFSLNGIVNTKFGKARAVEFSRRKLSRVKNDANNYFILIQKLPDGRALTVMAKSSGPMYRNNIINMVNSMSFNVPRTAGPYIRKSKDVYFDNNGNEIRNRSWSPETKSLYVNDFIKSNKTTWGIFIHDFWRYNMVPNYEAMVGSKFKYMILYHNFNENNQNVTDSINNAKMNERIVELTLQTNMQNGRNIIYDVLDGKKDEFLKDMANRIKEQGYPTLFRLGNEMNGDWCSYSAWNTALDSDIYKEFYNYIYNIMENAGANQYLIYVFNPNGRSFPDFKYNQESMYRPLDARFDVCGLTLYNTGNYYKGEKWETFDELYGPLYKHDVERFDKPLMIGEFGCSSIGGYKPAWTRDMLNKMSQYNRIKVAIWFNGIDRDANGNPARIYVIDDPKENVQVFKEYFSKLKK